MRKFLNPFARQKRKRFQIAIHVAVVGIIPVLIELIGRRQFGVEPDIPRFGLAEFLSARRGEQREHHRVRLALPLAPNQIRARRDIAPLVTAADLQRAIIAVKQFQIIVRLHQAVRELGVRNAVFAFESAAHRFFLHHHIDGKILADLAQKFHHRHRVKPLGIVHQLRRIFPFASKSRNA